MSQRQKIDARGAFCPGPLMELIATLKLIQIGDEVEIWSTDQGSAADIPEWCAKVGHTHVGTTKDGDHWSIVVRKAK